MNIFYSVQRSKMARKIIKYLFASGFMQKNGKWQQETKKGETMRKSDRKIQVFLNENGK